MVLTEKPTFVQRDESIAPSNNMYFKIRFIIFLLPLCSPKHVCQASTQRPFIPALFRLPSICWSFTMTEIPKMFAVMHQSSTEMVNSNHSQRLAVHLCLSSPVEALRRADPPYRQPHLVSTNTIQKPKIKNSGWGGGSSWAHWFVAPWNYEIC